MFLFQQDLDKVIELLEEFKIYAIYFFGSMVKNKLREDSNIDIAFLTEEDIDDFKVFMKSQKISDVFKKDCSLINLKKSSTVLKMQIIGRGKVIYCSDNLKKSLFEMKSFKEYALLNEERCEVLDVVKKTGCAYGKRYIL